MILCSPAPRLRENPAVRSALPMALATKRKSITLAEDEKLVTISSLLKFGCSMMTGKVCPRAPASELSPTPERRTIRPSWLGR